jgi:sugar phosphate isomerase/epimerase
VARELLEDEGVQVLSVFHYEDYAHPDKDKAEAARVHFLRAIDIAEALDCSLVTCNAWVAGADEAAQLSSYKSIYSELANVAGDRGVRMAIENCPHGGRNYASSPARWEKMFDAVSSTVIGLEYDPSHLVWQGIEPVAPIREFGSRIYAFHAKDTEILSDVLQREGILGSGWWRYRVPGWGQVNWTGIFGALADINYEGDMVIEHEDPVFSGDRFREGLRLGLRCLRKYAV